MTYKEEAEAFRVEQQRRADKLLQGRRIEQVIVGNGGSDRIQDFEIVLDDGSTVEISHWAAYADDSGMEFDRVDG